jgi:hypothetical protein
MPAEVLVAGDWLVPPGPRPEDLAD